MIAQELRHAIDKHTRHLIVSNIELLLNYPAVFGQAIASGVDQFLRAHITPEGELIYEEDEPAPMLWRYVPAHI